MNTNDRSIARISKSVRIWRKRLAQELMPRKTKPPLVRLEPQDDAPVVDQLRNILSSKANAKKFVEQLAVWDVDDDRHVSRKEFRRAFAYLGFTAPADDLNTLFDEIDTNGNGEVDYDELDAALQRMQSGVAPAFTGDAAAKLAAKEASTAEVKRAKHAAKLAAADSSKSRALLRIAQPPARVAPPPARVATKQEAPALPKPPAVVTWDPVGGFSPAMQRVATAISPTVRRSLSAMSPAMARAAGVQGLFACTPNTQNNHRLDKWSALAAQEKGAWHDPSAPRAPMRPPAALRRHVAA